jgi:hypothetical protein
LLQEAIANREVFRLSATHLVNEHLVATPKAVSPRVNVPGEKVTNRGMEVRFIKMSDRHIRLVRQV